MLQKRKEVIVMGTKLGAWINLFPFHKGGKLSAGEYDLYEKFPEPLLGKG
jgi:hypothetical protein